MINKKAVAILGAIFILIVGTVGVLLYQRSQKSSEEVVTLPPTDVPPIEPPPGGDFVPPNEIPPVEPPTEIPPTEVPPPSTGLLVTPVRLGEAAVVTPVLFYQGDGIAYLNTQGQLFQASLTTDGNGAPQLADLQELVIPQKGDIQKVLWPNSGNNFMVERMEGGVKRFSVYISDRGEYVDFPQQFISVSWMPGGEQILYVWRNEQNKATLNIANADGSNWKTIVEFWEPDNAIAVSPDARTVAFYEMENQTELNKLNVVTIDGKVFKGLVRDGHNSGTVWSPDSRQILFTKRSADGDKGLYLVNTISGEVKNLNLKIDSLDKVVWSPDSRTIYASGTSDSGDEQLFRIDSESGVGKAFAFEANTDVREPFLNATNNILFFRNAWDGNKLYYIDLSKLGQ